MKASISLIAVIAAMPALAQQARQLDAHEHGVGALDIAIEGNTVAMAFHAPGADIVGFEYRAESDAELAAIDAAVAMLNAPLDLFVMPDAAACTVTKAQAELESEHDYAEEDHDDHAENEHANQGGHNEFHAEYTFTCDDPEALTKITFAYFETFSNAQEVQVQMIKYSGAEAFMVERDAPVLVLGR